MTKKDIKEVLEKELKEKKTALLKEKEDKKKKKSIIKKKEDGGFDKMSSTGHGDSTMSEEEEMEYLEEAIKSSVKNEIKKMKKKGMEDEEIMLQIGKKPSVKQKDMDDIAKYLLKL